MWVHIVIFVMIFSLCTGWKAGWIPDEGIWDKKSKRLVILVALCGNILGMLLTVQNGSGTIYSQGHRLRKEETGAYEEKFVVSVDGEEAGSMYVQIPERESEEEEPIQQEQELSEEEQREKKLIEAVAVYNQEINDPDYYYLPENWEGKHLDWKEPGDTSGSLLSGVCLLAALALLVVKAREEQERLAKRNEQFLMDYPGMIMKFTLLVQAGMTVRKVFQKIALDYRKKQPAKPRLAYEEVMVTCYEMDSGVSEAEAYRRFGERCGHVKYKTFATLLIQNLQKGSRHLSDMLEKESMEAWEERKRKARVMGETAATRLLVPMILMMIVVMALVMIPAMLSFYGGV